MEPRAVTIGHIVYDIRNYVEEFPEPDHTAIMRMHPKVSGGGSAANVALNLCRLGIPAGVIGNVASDRHGKILNRPEEGRGGYKGGAGFPGHERAFGDNSRRARRSARD